MGEGKKRRDEERSRKRASYPSGFSACSIGRWDVERGSFESLAGEETTDDYDNEVWRRYVS